MSAATCRWWRRAAMASAAIAALGLGCGGATTATTPTTATAQTGSPSRKVESPPPQLDDATECPGERGFSCATLRVPLDRGGRVAGTLALRVATADNTSAPKGVLVYLTGGPGQPGVPFLTRTRARLGPAVLRAYRLVLLDQRGTGGGALRCPALQRAVGTSDLTVPPPAAVVDCAQRLGARRSFFSTADTVADLDALRAALAAPRLSFDGVSYGTFVAMRYAIAHPARVGRLVLDSVVPAVGLDGLEETGMRATARVLRAVCRARRCPGDPVADLAAIVRRDRDGARLFDTIVALSVGAPEYPGLPEALHDARAGRGGRLRALVAAVARAQRADSAFFSQGLHAATLCADLRAPWGDGATPRAARAAPLARAVARSHPEPFDRATVAGNGLVRTCLRWPAAPAPPAPAGGRLPPAPALLLAGDRDLSTPLEWAREQEALTPRGRLVVVPGAGHGVQSRAVTPRGRRAVREFLLR